METNNVLLNPAAVAVATLPEAIGVLTEYHETAWDARTPAMGLRFDPSGERGLDLAFNADGPRVVQPWAQGYRHASAMAGIPWDYAQSMIVRGGNDLAAINLNRWLAHEPKTVTVRAVGNRVRAILSERYRSIPPLSLVEVAIEEMASIAPGTLEFGSGALDPMHAILQMKSLALQGAPRVGDIVQGGIELKTSDVGDGSAIIALRLFRLSCLNGATVGLQESTRIRHFGSDDDRFVHDRVRAGVRAAFSQFNSALDQMSRISEQRVVDPIAALERVAERYSFNEDRAKRLLLAFGAEPESTGFGLMQAVTRAAQAETDITDRMEMERAGGDLMAHLAQHGIEQFNQPSRN